MEEVIAECYSQSLVYSILDGNDSIPANYWIDPSLYALEFLISDYFLTSLGDVSLNGITADMFGLYPNIHIPIFGVYDDDTVRIIGHVKLYYTCGEYECWGRPVLKNALSDRFISGEVKHFLEEIDAFNGYQCVADALGLSNISRPILLRYPMATESGEKLLLVVEEDEVYIYDFMNTAHFAEGEERLVMTPDQYIAQRSEYEKTVQSTPQLFGGIGGSQSTTQSEQSPMWIGWYFIISAALLGAAVIVFCIYRAKKN